jgi:hypothetical protein
VSSSANPWLDFLPASKATSVASELNEDLEEYCSSGPSLSGSERKRLYGFGLLPIVPQVGTASILETIKQISSLPHLKGVILGTQGLGKGLDDDALNPVWEAIEKASSVLLTTVYCVNIF